MDSADSQVIAGSQHASWGSIRLCFDPGNRRKGRRVLNIRKSTYLAAMLATGRIVEVYRRKTAQIDGAPEFVDAPPAKATRAGTFISSSLAS
jgi:hypothetical protein